MPAEVVRNVRPALPLHAYAAPFAQGLQYEPSVGLFQISAPVPDLHLGMDAVIIDDGVHTPESGCYRLDVTRGRGTADEL